MDPFPLRRTDRVIGHGIDVARRADHGNDICADGRLLGAGQQALSRGRVRYERSELGLLTTLAFMAVYLLIGTPWVLFVMT